MTDHGAVRDETRAPGWGRRHGLRTTHEWLTRHVARAIRGETRGFVDPNNIYTSGAVSVLLKNPGEGSISFGGTE